MALPSKRSKAEELAIRNESLVSQLRYMEQHAKIEELSQPVTTDFAALRNAARRTLEDKIMTAYSKFDTEAAIWSIQERIINEAQEVSDILMGIDRRWSKTELKDGRIRALIEHDVDRIITENLQPLVIAEVERQIKLKSMQKAVDAAIKDRVQSAIRSLTYGSSDIARMIDSLVSTEMQKIMSEFTCDLSDTSS